MGMEWHEDDVRRQLRRMRWERETEQLRREAAQQRRRAKVGWRRVRKYVLRISKAKAARICGVSRTTVQRWEDPGSSSLPDIGHMAALARQYGWTLMEYAREWLGLEGGSEDQKARR